jgi:hypothetical protein
VTWDDVVGTALWTSGSVERGARPGSNKTGAVGANTWRRSDDIRGPRETGGTGTDLTGNPRPAERALRVTIAVGTDCPTSGLQLMTWRERE